MLTTTRIAYTPIEIRGQKTVKCQGCGRRLVRAKRFWQTRSPFNQKSRDEIYEELREERRAWLAESEVCKHCKEVGDVSDRNEESR